MMGTETPGRLQPFDDPRDRRGRVLVVHGHPHQLAAGPRQRRDLPDGAGDVGGVRVGHRLHHDGVA